MMSPFWDVTQPFSGRLPIVEFDPALVTGAIKADIRKCIDDIEGATDSQRAIIHDAALRSVSEGRNLGLLSSVLVNLGVEGMTKSKAGAIARHVNGRATALMNDARQRSLGIEYATWICSGLSCIVNRKTPAPEDIQRDKVHRALNGQRYKVGHGIRIGDKWTLPGYEEGCVCMSKSIIPGFL